MAKPFNKEDLEKLGIKPQPKTLEEVEAWKKDRIKENQKNQESTVAKIVAIGFMLFVIYLIYLFLNL